MNNEQITAVRMAMLDLRGVLQAEQWMDVCAMRDGIADTLDELEAAFPYISDEE